MVLPDYKGTSIVNLMSSIGGAFGWKSPYVESKFISSEEIKKYRNVVLLVIDGMGYNYLMRKGDFLKSKVKAKMISVFPATTSAAMSTFNTGLPPQQIAVTGWFMLLKEIGIVSRILPFDARIGGNCFSELGYKMSDFLDVKDLARKLKTKVYSFMPKFLVKTEYTKYMNSKAKVIGYDKFGDMLSKLKIVLRKKGKKYVSAYWPDLDSLEHEFGTDHKKTDWHLKQIEIRIKKFSKSLGKDSLLIITADHGLINVPEENALKIEDHPKLQECMSLPMAGEGRNLYCYVHPSKALEFENYVKSNLSKYCEIFKSEELIKKNYFGLFEPNKKLFHRVGDYVLLMKDNYKMKDKIEKDKSHYHLGNHAGTSEDEMFVPLIVIN